MAQMVSTSLQCIFRLPLPLRQDAISRACLLSARNIGHTYSFPTRLERTFHNSSFLNAKPSKRPPSRPGHSSRPTKKPSLAPQRKSSPQPPLSPALSKTSQISNQQPASQPRKDDVQSHPPPSTTSKSPQNAPEASVLAPRKDEIPHAPSEAPSPTGGSSQSPVPPQQAATARQTAHQSIRPSNTPRTPSSAPQVPATPPPAPPRASSPAEIFAMQATHYANNILGPKAEEAMLYHAPRHLGFAIFAISCAVGFGWLSMSAFFLALPGMTVGSAIADAPWYLRVVMTFSSLMAMIMATTFLVAPTRLVRSVKLVRGKVADPTTAAPGARPPPPFLRFNVHSYLPGTGIRGKTIDVPLGSVALDVKVRSTKVTVRDVEIAHAQDFTRAFDNGIPRWEKEMGGSQLGQNVQRMFLRQDMVIVAIDGKGKWKLDLYHAAVLDGAAPLRQLMREEHVDMSFIGKVRSLLDG